MEEPKHVVLIGKRSSELLDELRRRYSFNEYNVYDEAGFQPAHTKVVIYLTTHAHFKRACREMEDLASLGCKTLVIDIDDQPWELVIDKASGFLEAIL